MQPFQERVVEEREQLAERLAKLDDFLGTLGWKLPPDEASRMLRQQTAMSIYLNILDERIARFQDK